MITEENVIRYVQMCVIITHESQVHFFRVAEAVCRTGYFPGYDFSGLKFFESIVDQLKSMNNLTRSQVSPLTISQVRTVIKYVTEYTIPYLMTQDNHRGNIKTATEPLVDLILENFTCASS